MKFAFQEDEEDDGKNEGSGIGISGFRGPESEVRRDSGTYYIADDSFPNKYK